MSERFLEQPHACRTPLRQERSLGCARDDETGGWATPIPFHSAAGANLRPFGAPPSKGRREKSKILPAMGKAVKREYRCSAPKAFPSRGRCPEGADRALAAGKREGKYVSSRRKMRVPSSPYCHFERSEKSSLHNGQRESVRGRAAETPRRFYHYLISTEYRSGVKIPRLCSG